MQFKITFLKSKSAFWQLVVWQLFFLFSPLTAFAVDFYGFNAYLGICPLSKTLTYTSNKGSYAAYVKDPTKFAKICPNIGTGTQMTLKKLDQYHWLIDLAEHQIQFRFEDVGYRPDRGDAYRITKICDDCPLSSDMQAANSDSIGPNINRETAAGTDTAMSPEADRQFGTQPEYGKPFGKQEEEMVIFDFDKYQVKPPYYYIIDKMAAELKANPKLKVELRGHTCSIGSKQYNDALSKKRSAAVKKYLIGKGIAANRIVAKGYGYSKPFAGNGTPDGRSQNRRVRIVKN